MTHRLLLRLCSLLATATLANGQQGNNEAVDLGLPAKPTEVLVGIYVIDVIGIDGANQTFRADMAFRLRWHDPRLKQPGGELRRLGLDDVWHPRILSANVRSSDLSMPDLVEVDADGWVTYRQRAIGEFACPLDLRSFPRDRQSLFLQLVASGFRTEDVVFKVDEEATGMNDTLSITDWAVNNMAAEAKPFFVPNLGFQLPGVILRFEVERLTGYYVGTIFATVAIIALMAWLVYWLPLGAVAPRVSVSVTSMLALIAYRFVAGQDLPRLPYLTQMDFFLLGAALLVLLGMVTVVAVAHQESGGNQERARRLNRIFRWAYPVVLAILILSFAL